MQPDAVVRVRGAHRRTATGAGAGLGRSSSPSSTRRAFGSDPVGWNAETAHAQLLKLLDAVDTVRDGHAWPASTRDDSSGSYLLRVATRAKEPSATSATTTPPDRPTIDDCDDRDEARIAAARQYVRQLRVFHVHLAVAVQRANDGTSTWEQRQIDEVPAR